MSKFTTIADFDGPSLPNQYRTELTRIIDQMVDVPLAYVMDATLHVGGDFLEITTPPGCNRRAYRWPN